MQRNESHVSEQTETGGRYLQAKEFRGLLATTRSWERMLGQIVTTPSSPNHAGRHLHFTLLASRTVKEYVSIAEATRFVVLGYCSPRSKIHSFTVVEDFSLMPVHLPGPAGASGFSPQRQKGLLPPLSQSNGFMSGPCGHEVHCCALGSLRLCFLRRIWGRHKALCLVPPDTSGFSSLRSCEHSVRPMESSLRARAISHSVWAPHCPKLASKPPLAFKRLLTSQLINSHPPDNGFHFLPCTTRGERVVCAISPQGGLPLIETQFTNCNLSPPVGFKKSDDFRNYPASSSTLWAQCSLGVFIIPSRSGIP